MQILTDIDGVCLDWFSGFKKYVTALNIPTLCDSPTDWNLDSWLDHRNISRLVEDYNHTAEFGILHPYQDAIDILPKLYYKYDHQLVAVTASSKSLVSQQLRRYNIRLRFGDIFEDVHFVEPGSSKLDILKRFDPTIWIEDRPKAALEGLEAGHKVFLMSRDYNLNFEHPAVTRVRGWEEMVDHIDAYADALYSGSPLPTSG